jgi:hypothetical protein
MEAFDALCSYWHEETPPANVLIAAIARTLGCKFGKESRPNKIEDTETLFQHMKIDPKSVPKWEPKHQIIRFGDS